MFSGRPQPARLHFALSNKIFIRFTVERRDERSGSEEGLFTVAYRELSSPGLADYEREWLEELLAWFKKKVKIPGAILRDDVNRRAICWFRESSKEVVSKAFELAVFLRERGYQVEPHRTEVPGILVYEDGHQVAAKPLRKNRRYFKHAIQEGKYDEK
jgi:hypothetical protein